MNVVHIVTTDYGGAYRAAQRINDSMQSVGVSSAVLVREKTNPDSNVICAIDNPFRLLLSKTKNYMNLKASKGEVITDLFGTDITRHPLVKKADVVILHWVNSFVSYDTVQKLLEKGKPIVWVMHDMWPFTGGCHCDFYCGKYKIGCGKCPQISSTDMKDGVVVGDADARHRLKGLVILDGLDEREGGRGVVRGVQRLHLLVAVALAAAVLLLGLHLLNMRAVEQQYLHQVAGGRRGVDGFFEATATTRAKALCGRCAHG